MTAQTIPSVLRSAAGQYAALEVVDGTSRPAFADVADSVEQIERALIASGIVRGDRVAIWAPNGLTWILVSFAAYGVGGVLVPSIAVTKARRAHRSSRRPRSNCSSR
jgi:acyl-CoA synthetase (AMP-forming)/AMP-acid ligase II